MYVHSGAQQEHDEVGRGTGDKRKMTEYEIICILFAEVSFEGTGGYRDRCQKGDNLIGAQ